MTDEMKTHQKSNKFNTFKKICFCLSILLPPIALVAGLHLGNWLNSIYPNINLNPFGVDNVTWFGFWGGYLGGVCTLITFILTARSNEQNLDKTIKENQKQLIYQQEMVNINEELKVISLVLPDLNPTQLVGYYYSLIKMPTTNGVYSKNEVGKLIREIDRAQQILISNKTRLELETDICNQRCLSCKNLSVCTRGECVKAFSKKHYDVYAKIYTSNKNCIELLDTLERNSDAKIQIENIKTLLNSKSLSNDEHVKLESMVKEFETDICDPSDRIKKLKNDMHDIKEIYYKEINNLTMLAKQYISELKKNANDKLNDKKTLLYIEDTGISKQMKDKHESDLAELMGTDENIGKE